MRESNEVNAIVWEELEKLREKEVYMQIVDLCILFYSH